MSETFSKIEVISNVARRRRFTTEQKMAIIAETLQPGVTMSSLRDATACRQALCSGGGA